MLISRLRKTRVSFIPVETTHTGPLRDRYQEHAIVKGDGLTDDLLPGSEDLDEKLASGGQDETKSSLSRRGTQNFEKSQRVEEEQHRGMEKAFPPPSYQLAREELAR